MDIVSFGLASKVSKAIEALIGDSKITIPSGTTAERPVLLAGDKAIRFNTDTNGLESWDGDVWRNVSANVTAVTIKGTDTEANILLKSGDAGDVWVASDTLDGWLYDGTNWLSIGALKGPKGVGITGIVLDSTVGLVDTYVITYSNTTTSTYEITNGKDGAMWLSGSIDPTTEGVAGDMYLNTNSYNIFKKIAGTWTFQTNIKGAVGEGLTILGSLNNETLLPATGNAGEGYIVTGYLYVWTGIEWKNVGLIQGPKGDVGLTGSVWLTGAVDPTTEGVDTDMYLNTVTMDVFKNTSGVWALKTNIKGAQGIQGKTGNGIASVALTNTVGNTKTYTITFTDTSTTTFDVTNGLNGTNGVDGQDVDHVSKTSGTGTAGTTDTYTVWLDAGETVSAGTFNVYNGADGLGAGDMVKSIYDPTNINASVFDTDNHISGTTNKVYTATEQTKLSGIAKSADVTSANETSHADVLVDGDFTTAGFMKTDGAGNYSIDTNTYLTSETSHPADALVAQDITNIGNLSGTNTGDQDLSGYSLTSHHHSGVYEPADATILKDADIGSTVQGYDANTTTAGNTFNGVSQLVKLDGTGKLPAIDGSQLTNMPASVTVNNTLTSTSTTEALSAAQGKALQDGKVDNNRVLTDVPTGAVFTDTVYDDTAISAAVALNTAKRSYPLADETKLGTVEDSANNYTHPTGDGNLHVPVNGTGSDGKVLTSSATAGIYTWETIPAGVTDHILLTNIGTRTHAQLESDIAGKQATLVSGTNIKTVGGSSILGSGNIVTVDSTKLPLTGGTMTGAVTSFRETKIDMGANDINLASGNLFTKTISAATTLTMSNKPASGQVISFILELTNAGSAVITWFSGVKWAGGTAPTLTTAGKDILGCYSHDGGLTWNVLVLGKDVK